MTEDNHATHKHIEILQPDTVLNESHIAELKTSAIDCDILTLNFESLDGEEAAEALLYSPDISRLNDGRISSRFQRYRDLGDGWWCSGLDINNGESMNWGCFKPDEPQFDKKKDKLRKYEHPAKETTEYFALRVSCAIGLKIAQRYGLAEKYTQRQGEQPANTEDKGFWKWAIEQKGQIPLILTEGAKKAACLLSHGYLAIALSGIWGAYRRSATCETDATLITGLKALVAERIVLFVFDQDESNTTKGNVTRAINFTTEVCLNAGAVACYRVGWELKDYPHKGIDDLIAACGVEVFEQLLKRRRTLGESAEQAAKKTGITDSLVEIGRDKAELWHNTEGIAYGDVTADGTRATYRLSSEAFGKWLRRELYTSEGLNCSSDTVKTAVDMLASFAEFDGEEREVFSRVGKHGDRYYLDLGTPDWSAIEYSAEGWRVVAVPPVRFERSLKASPLPLPVAGGNLHELFSFINAEAEDYPLLTGFLMKCLIPDGTEPILILHGEQGSGKSSAAEVLKRMVDPSTPNMLKSVSDVRTVAIYAQKTRVLLYDNLSHLSPETSDLMCSMSTGGGHVERSLYTNDELTTWSFKRPQIMTGIDEIANRGDLLDRSLMVELLPILGGHYRAESDYWEEFHSIHPQLLGALLDAVCMALGVKGKTPRPVGYRMVEFAHLASAADVHLGYEAGAFMARLSENKERGHEVAMESSPVAMAIGRLVNDSPGQQWSGSGAALLIELNRLVDENAKRKKWPTTTKVLGKEITRIAPSLRQLGINIDRQRDMKERLYSFYK
jgi:Domain of unknown function (DUF3854)